jgi:hypothetical protein
LSLVVIDIQVFVFHEFVSTGFTNAFVKPENTLSLSSPLHGGVFSSQNASAAWFPVSEHETIYQTP